MRLLALIIGLSVFLSQAHAQQPVSGFEFLSKESQEMQLDEFSNPGMNAVESGHQLFNTPGNNEKSCASCHGEDGEKIIPKNIARYPLYDAQQKRVLTLQRQVNRCWENRLDNFPLVADSAELVDLETYVRYLARGETVNVDVTGPMQKYYRAGEKLYNTRFGQIDMACVHCHVYHQGQYLRGQKLTQGHSNGFPEYRLGTGRITSFQRRIRECFVSFRAEPFDFDAEEMINLEVYVHAKGNGLKIETPAVRY